MTLSSDRFVTAIVEQTDGLRDAVRAVDPDAEVTTCPGWSMGALGRHMANAQLWAAEIINTGALFPPDERFFRQVARADIEPSAAELDDALAGSSAALAAALRGADPRAMVWAPVGPRPTSFFARRYAHETAIHRADGAITAGLSLDAAVDSELAADAIDEWLELGAIPEALEVHPERAALLGPGRTIHLHATDAPAAARAEWVVDLTGDRVSWRRSHEKSTVAVRGPVAELLYLVYGRRPAGDARFDIFGDRALLDDWLAANAFG